MLYCHTQERSEIRERPDSSQELSLRITKRHFHKNLVTPLLLWNTAASPQLTLLWKFLFPVKSDAIVSGSVKQSYPVYQSSAFPVFQKKLVQRIVETFVNLCCSRNFFLSLLSLGCCRFDVKKKKKVSGRDTDSRYL